MSQLPDTDLVGALLAGRYRVLRKLGEGAMGAVYLAEHLNIGRKDAIKVLRDNLANDPEAIARFLRGTRNVSAIRHANVCAIYDFSQTEGGLRFLAMEYVEGPTLKEVLDREGTLPVERAVDIACQVAAALDAAHGAGIVHRDLKPANIMLVRGKAGADVVKVVDFDIAKGPEGGEEVTRLGFVIGTPEYMSPEQLMGEPLDGRSDVYSLGLVLFRMLTGTLPFHAEGTQDIMIARLTSAPMRLDEARPGTGFPEALQHALDRALQRKPADRQEDAEQFAHELRAAVPTAPGQPFGTGKQRAPVGLAATVLMPPTRVEPVTTAGGTHNRRKIVLFGGVGLVVAALIAITIYISDGETTDPSQQLAIPPATVDTGEQVAVVPPPAPPPTGGERTDSPPVNRQDPPRRDPVERDPLDPPGIRFASETSIATVLEGLTERVLGENQPARTQLVAIVDTLDAVHKQTATDDHKRTAARLLAIVESYRGNGNACRRWVAEVGALGGDITRLQPICPSEQS
jgi:serine/threonine-protein kinase